MKKGLGEKFLFDKEIKFEEIEGGEGYTYSDGSGYFNGDDGTEIYIYSDKSGYYKDKEGSDGYIYTDGSGYYNGSDGSTGYKYSDGTGYFNNSDGDYNRYDSNSIYNENQATDDYLGEISSLLNYYERAYELKRRIEQEEKNRIRKENWRKFYLKHKKIVIYSIIIMLLMIAIPTTIGINKIIELEKTRITMKKGYKAYLGEDYEIVAEEFEELGFESIELIPGENLITGWINEENTVKEIKIGDDEKFEQGEKFYRDEKIKIIYHSFKNK